MKLYNILFENFNIEKEMYGSNFLYNVDKYNQLTGDGLPETASKEEVRRKAEEAFEELTREQGEIAKALRNATKARNLVKEQLKREIRKAVLQELKARRNR